MIYVFHMLAFIEQKQSPSMNLFIFFHYRVINVVGIALKYLILEIVKCQMLNGIVLMKSFPIIPFQML